MIEYNKIDTVFERDLNGSKKLIDGKFRDPTVEFLKDIQWEMTEKIDGTNISVVWDGHKVTFHGRTERAQIPSNLVNKLNDMFAGEKNEEIFEQVFGEKEVILFGEGYGNKIQKGSAYLGEEVSFILFDVLISGNYQPRTTVENIAKTFGIDCVPIVLTGKIQDGVDFIKSKPKSTIGTAMMEGVVARPVVELKDRCGKRIIVKIKVKDF